MKVYKRRAVFPYPKGEKELCVNELSFVYTKVFTRKWESLGYENSDKETLEDLLLNNPEKGPVMKKTGGLRKMRFALKDSKGKSSGSRICYYYTSKEGVIYFLDIFPKKEKGNLSEKEKAQVKKLIKKLKG